MPTSEALQHEIRTTRPAAPDALRERVRALAAEQPVREPLFARLLPRRAVLVPIALVVALFAVGVVGLSRTGPSSVTSSRESGGVTAEQSADSALKAAPPTAATGTAPAPTPGRLQNVDVEMRLRVAGVEELSSATKRAMRLAQSLGGYVESVQYDAPAAGIGGAQLTLRIPNDKVQGAITQLSALGTILGQRIGIADLQASADDLGDRIVEARQTIARLQTQLRSTTLLAEERAVIRARLEQARGTLADLQASLKATRAEGQLATVQLSLTTEPIEAAPANGSRLDRLGDVLIWEGVALLYVLAIAGPFALLGVIAWLVLRARRRRDEARLLEAS